MPPLLEITHESLIVAQEPNDKWSTIDTIQVGLDIAGYIPVIGIVADLTNAGIHLVRGNYVDAGLSAIGAIPGFGDAIKGGAKIAKAAGGVAGAVGQTAKQGAKVAEAGTDFAKTCKKGSDTCFTAGTQIVVGAIYDENDVFVQYIAVNIEDIKVGDLVYSYDTITGEVSYREVTAVFVRESDHINYLTIVDEHGNEQVIETTDSHPFWVVTDEPDLERAARSVVVENGVWLYHENIGPTEHGFWVEAKDLREGDVFLGANGELSILVSAERVQFEETIKVYNFTVDGYHNYFVIAKCDPFGQTSVLVHNATNYLAKNMKAVGAKPKGNYHAHHDLAQKHREKFAMRGIDIDKARYGRWIEGSSHLSWSPKFTKAWDAFFASNPNANTTEVLRKMLELRRSGKFQ